MSMLSLQCDKLRESANNMRRIVANNHHLEKREADWLFSADTELREAADTIEGLREKLQGGTCELELNTDMSAIRCDKCGYELPKGADLKATWFCGGCGRAVKR